MKTSLITLVAAGFLICNTSIAAAPGGRSIGERKNPGTDWVTFVSPSAASKGVSVHTQGTVQGPRPSVLLQTSSYVYTAGQPLELLLTIDANGYDEPVTLYMFRQNRRTGTKEFFSFLGRQFIPGGEARDLFGVAGSPAAINVPTLSNFRLFGTGGALGSAPADSAGLYQYVVEVRDAAGARVISSNNAMYSLVDAVVPITTDITSNTTWTANNAYLLNKTGVFVRNGATLTIEPGTFVFGSNAQKAALVIDRGGKINANGTNMRPIVFTSDQAVGNRGRRGWGGLIINGRAPVNIPGGVGEGEGDTGNYGGNDPNDDSGVLRYVRVEFGGIDFSTDNELNGIAFQGVGRGTVIEHIQVHYNQDDGVEFFGGTADAKYVLLTGIGDDSLDWVEGWIGRMQFVVAVQEGGNADNGIEADNKGGDNDLLPRSAPTIYNMTLIGAPSGGEAESNNGILLREGTAGVIHNFIVAHFNEAGVAIRNPSTHTQTQNGSLIVDNGIFFSNLEGYDRSPNTPTGTITADGALTRTFIEQTMRFNRLIDPMLADPLDPILPDIEPLAGSPALDIRFVRTPPDDGFFDTTVDYIGAVGPNDNWPQQDWTTYAPN